MNWLLWKHVALENAKLIGTTLTFVVLIMTVVILMVWMMTLSVTTSLLSFLIGGWLVLTFIDYFKAKRERES